MDILLVNSNPIVNRLISLCSKQVSANINIKHSLELSDLSIYDKVFIDEAMLDEKTTDILKSTHIGTRILLASKNFNIDDSIIFDYIVDKPFLPSKIVEILQDNKDDKDNEVTFNLDELDDNYDTQILDNNELAKIKNILKSETNIPKHIEEIEDIDIKKQELIKEHLKLDGLEIIDEEEYIENITKKKTKSYKKTLKKLIKNAIDEIIDEIGKKEFKQAVKEDRVSIDINIKE